MSAQTLYVIWSEEHLAWWRQSRYGYTRSLLEAGRFGEFTASEIVTHANRPQGLRKPNEFMIPDPLAEEKISEAKESPASPAADDKAAGQMGEA